MQPARCVRRHVSEFGREWCDTLAECAGGATWRTWPAPQAARQVAAWGWFTGGRYWVRLSRGAWGRAGARGVCHFQGVIPRGAWGRAGARGVCHFQGVIPLPMAESGTRRRRSMAGGLIEQGLPAIELAVTPTPATRSSRLSSADLLERSMVGRHTRRVLRVLHGCLTVVGTSLSRRQSASLAARGPAALMLPNV